jgi:preprotein translocase subunit YajC
MLSNAIFPLLILFMIGLVFMSSRQRKKQQSQQESLQQSLSVGDVVVMTSGISGTIVDVDDERTIDVEIAPEVITTWLRAAVREKLVADLDAEHAALDAEHEALEADDRVLGESSVPTTESTPSVTKDQPEDARSTGADGISSPRSS